MSNNVTMDIQKLKETMGTHGRTFLSKSGRTIVQNYVDELSSLLDSQTASLENAERVVAVIRAEIKDTSARLKKAKIDLERIDTAPELDALDREDGLLSPSMEMSEQELADVLENDELSTSERIRRVARHVLERSQPLKRKNLLKAVTEVGLVIEAADPADTLRKALERDADFSKNAQGYWLNRRPTAKATS